MKKTILLSFLLTVVLLAFSQKEEKSAKVYLLSGDSLLGKVNYQLWKKNPRSFYFTNLTNGRKQELGLNEISEIVIDGTERFKRAIVIKYINTLDLETIPDFYEEPSVTDTVFLRELLTGNKFNLYMLDEDIKVHFFIQKNGGAMEALRFVRYYKGANNLVEVKTYINQLSIFADDNPSLLRELSKINYNYENILRISEKLNSTSVLSKYAFDDIKTKKYSRWFVSTGVMTNQFKPVGVLSDVIARVPYKMSITPFFNGGYEILSRRPSNKFYGQLFAGLYHLNYQGERTYTEAGKQYKDEYQLSSFSSQIGIGLHYVFINKPLPVSFGGGAIYNINNWYKNTGTVYNLTDNNVFGNEVFDIKNVNMNFFGNVEIFLNKTSSIAVMYRFRSDLTFVRYVELIQTGFMLNYTYRFTRNAK